MPDVRAAARAATGARLSTSQTMESRGGGVVAPSAGFEPAFWP